MSMKAMKVSHKENKRVNNSNESYENYLKGRNGKNRLVKRLVNGRNVKPCDKECREYGFLIAKSFNHGSFQNFDELMDDKEFVLMCASLTPNPVMCENYFYKYINKFIKKDSLFKLNFLKAIYLNDNVYKLEDINTIVKMCGFQKENKIILDDVSFKRLMEKRLEEVESKTKVEYHCSGEDKKELHDYKVTANDMKVLCENMRKGLTKILKSFTCERKSKEEEFWDELLVEIEGKI